MTDVSTSLPAATVDVKTAWASKINWTQGVAMAAMLLTYFGVTLPPDVQAAICAAIIAVSTVATWVFKTWFTKTVTPASITGVPGGLPKLIAIFAVLVVSATMLSACMIRDPFGGPPLVLTGNLQADLPGIQSYAAEVQAVFQQYCPSVNDAATAAASVDPANVAANTGLTVSAATKQVGNVQSAANLAVTICNGGTATDVKTAFVNFAAAAKTVLGWINAAKGGS
jgi:hypothetical protein